MKRVYQYNMNHVLINTYKSLAEAGRAVGVTKETISACCNGKRNTAKGSVWSFDVLEPKEEDTTEYKDIKGYGGKYQISLDCDVRKVAHTTERGRVMPEKRILTFVDSEGYLSCCLNGENKRLHRLLYETFVGDIPEGMIVDHINRNRLDNRLENLRLVDSPMSILNRTLAYKPDIADLSKNYKHPEKAHPFQLKFSENGKRVTIGYYRTYEEAEEKYKELYNKRQNRIDYACS